MARRVLTCVGTEFEVELLAHFVAHYRGLGIPPDHIHAILHARDPDHPGLAAARGLATRAGLAPPRIWTQPYTSDAMWAERRAFQQQVAAPDDWILNADVDEHHVYPCPLDDLIAFCERLGADVVQGVLVDRLAPGGALIPVKAAPELARQFPIAADLSIALFGRRRGAGLNGTLKIMLHRGSVFPRRGGHEVQPGPVPPRYLTGAPLSRHPAVEDAAARLRLPFRVDHYMWTAARLPKIERRVTTTGASAAGQHFGARVQAYLAEHGRIRLRDVVVARPEAPPVTAWRRWVMAAKLRARLRRVLRRG